ncbi:hypothetical protein ACS0TY_004099 [Phlomoides rotata]
MIAFIEGNVPGDLRASLSLTLGVHNTLNTGHYLGIPSLVGRNKKQNFNYIKESMWFILQGWRGKKHSKAGKEILIKVAAQSISTYCMSTFLRPSILLDNLYCIGSDASKGIKWTNFDNLCMRKEDG